MADLARGKLRSKLDALAVALEGAVTDHHRVLLRISIQMTASYDQAIAALHHEVQRMMEPYQAVSEQLQSIPGVKKKTAETIVAEIGVDMSRFPSDAHLCSWAGVSPGNNDSAGKRHSGRTTHGNKWLKSGLTEAAWAAARTKGTYLKARYHRLAARRGKKKATLAVGHTILIMAYHIIKEHITYRELGANYFDRLNEQYIVKHLLARMQNLGYQVTLKKETPVSVNV
jgi:transposase